MANRGDDGQMLTTRDVAALFRVHPKTVEEWRHRGIGPRYLKLPTGTVRYTRSAVSSWSRSRLT